MITRGVRRRGQGAVRARPPQSHGAGPPRHSGRLLAALLLLCPVIPVSAAEDFLSPGMTPAELQQRLAGEHAPLVVDLRAPVEYGVAHIPGAVNIPLAELEARIAELRRPDGVVIYCINGSRTRQAEPVLYAHGIDNFFHLEGTLQAWLKAKLPYEKGGAKRSRW